MRSLDTLHKEHAEITKFAARFGSSVQGSEPRSPIEQGNKLNDDDFVWNRGMNLGRQRCPNRAMLNDEISHSNGVGWKETS